MATEPTGTIAAGAVTLLDVPLCTGAHFVFVRTRFGVGPLVSLHVLAATREEFGVGRSDVRHRDRPDVRRAVGLPGARG